MKRYLICLLAFIMALSLFSGCNREVADDGRLKVVCTMFPQYDWATQIIGDKAENIELTLLLDNMVDLHSYQPTVEDVAKISSCDLFIYVGGVSDAWVEDVLKSAVNENMRVVNLLETLGESAKQEELKEGMEHEHEHDEAEHEGDDDHEGEGEHEHEGEYEDEEHDEHEVELDEHVWLSVKNARLFCTTIADALSSLDADNAGAYKSNSDAYVEQLAALDSEYQAAVNQAGQNTLLFCDRFPFRYLVDDYGIEYYAAFSGCSSESRASFETIIFLANKVDELGLSCVMVTESSDKTIAETVKNNTAMKDLNVLVMDSMQSVSAQDMQNGISYLFVMQSNLDVLKNALGSR